MHVTEINFFLYERFQLPEHKVNISFSPFLSFKIADFAENVSLKGPEKQAKVSCCGLQKTGNKSPVAGEKNMQQVSCLLLGNESLVAGKTTKPFWYTEPLRRRKKALGMEVQHF